jgi:hypothetical protein
LALEIHVVGKLKNDTKHGNNVLEEEIGNGWPLRKLIIAENLNY